MISKFMIKLNVYFASLNDLRHATEERKYELFPIPVQL